MKKMSLIKVHEEQRPIYTFSMIFTVVATIAGFLTLIPWPWASYPNVLGYHSLCTFAPGATFYCFFLAGLSCTLRATFVLETQGTGAEKIKKHLHALIPLLILLALALVATLWFAAVKGQYSDVSTGASL
jgi:hypothetical protein